MVQANGLRESSLQPSRVQLHGEKQRYRCKGPSPGTGKRLWRGSSGLILPALRFFDFMFEVRRPGEGDQQPHQQRCGDGKESVIEKSDGNETKNQMRTPPEPDVLMKYVECSDRNNKQDAFHAEWTLTLTKRFRPCQGINRKGSVLEGVLRDSVLEGIRLVPEGPNVYRFATS